MLRAPVVPEGQRIGLPGDPAPQPRRRGDVPVQHVQHGTALGAAQTDDVRREALVDVEDLAARARVAGDHRVLIAGIAAFRRRRLVRTDVGNRAVVDSRQPVQESLDGFGEQFVGKVHVGEQGVAAARLRRLGDVQHGPEWRNGVAGDVGMPSVAGRVRRLRGGLHRENLGVAAVLVLHRVHVQPTEAASEGLVLIPVQVLVPKHQELPVEPRIVDVLRLLIGQGRGQIDADDLRADMRRQRLDFESAVPRRNRGRIELSLSSIEHLGPSMNAYPTRTRPVRSAKDACP